VKKFLFEKRAEYVRNVVYGGLDGSITTFAIVSGVAGAALSPGVTLILGLANLIADGLSMAVGNYLSTKAEESYQHEERRKLKKELGMHLDKTEKDLIRYYKRKGYTLLDATEIVRLLAKKKNNLEQTALDEEFHAVESTVSPITGAITTFFSFLFFGFVPLFTYILALFFSYQIDTFLISSILTALVMFLLGIFKAAVTDKHWLRSGFESLILGGVAASLAFGIGYGLAWIA